MAELIPTQRTNAVVYGDANLLHEYVGNGLTIVNTYTEIENKKYNGAMLHIQRNGKGDISAGQVISQVNFGANGKTAIRYGIGDGTTINWTEWVEISTASIV